MSRAGSPSDFNEGVIQLFFAVNFMVDEGNIGFWTGYGDITIDGDEYVGAGELMSFSSVDEDNQVGANGVTVIIAGLDTESADLALDTDYQGRPAEILVGSLNNYPTIQYYKLFRGLIDQIAIKDGPETSTVAITLENRLIDLNRPRLLHYTDQEQRNLSPIAAVYPEYGYPSTLLVFSQDYGLGEVSQIQDKQIVWKP